MKYTLRTLFTLSTLALLAACGTHLSQEQCQTLDWHKMGVADGQIGLNKRSLIKEIDDCGRYSIEVDTERYQRGWDEGRRGYCQPRNAYQLGVQGKYYNTICPPDLQPAMDKAWREGLRLYCVPETAYNLGRKGAAMPGFCAADQVNDFRNGYDRGYHGYQRINHIQLQIDALQVDNARLQRRIDDNRSDISKIDTQLSRGIILVSGERLTAFMTHQLEERKRTLINQIQDLQRSLDMNKAQVQRLQLQMNALS